MKKMKKASVIIIALFCVMNLFSQNNINISVPLRTQVNISSAEPRSVPLVVVNEDILDRNGKLFIKENTPVKIDYKIKKKRGCGVPGKIKIVPISTFDVNGNEVCLYMTDGEFYQKGHSRTGTSVGCAIGLGLTVLPVFGFFFLCMKGYDLDVPAYTMIPSLTTTCEIKNIKSKQPVPTVSSQESPQSNNNSSEYISDTKPIEVYDFKIGDTVIYEEFPLIKKMGTIISINNETCFIKSEKGKIIERKQSQIIKIEN